MRPRRLSVLSVFHRAKVSNDGRHARVGRFTVDSERQNPAKRNGTRSGVVLLPSFLVDQMQQSKNRDGCFYRRGNEAPSAKESTEVGRGQGTNGKRGDESVKPQEGIQDVFRGAMRLKLQADRGCGGL
jgi:hypothetical protein